jgi:hypothetical protein
VGAAAGAGLWMVGDSIFPGQSTAAVALGGLRVARAILAEYGCQECVTASFITRQTSPVASYAQRLYVDA